MPQSHLLALDQGTTSTRALLFDRELHVVATEQQEFPQHFPRSGWVEHEAEDLWTTSVAVIRRVLEKSGLTAGDVAAIGITNQRETTVVWERDSGRAIHRAIVWQDRRTADRCAQLRAEGCEKLVVERTGLVLDPYFSASKLQWILDQVEGSRERAARGELAFGTVDSYLLWRLTGGASHKTDASNASRTLLLNLESGQWDEDLLKLFAVPDSMMPTIEDSAADFGATLPELFGGAIRVAGIAGDQQAATVGQACFQPGMFKSTYGTGAFALLNTGPNPVRSQNRLLTTVAYRLKGRTTYALEGAIFVAGAAVQWLRDSMKMIATAADTAPLAEQADPHQSIYLVPAFTGLGAPWWNAEARGALFGLSRATGPAELARATLESVGYQTRDLLEAMRRDWPEAEGAGDVLRVDGGMVASDWTLQFLADILGAPVDRPAILETTSLGAAYLAGLQTGVCPEPDRFAESWRLERRFTPAMSGEERDQRYEGWQRAVAATIAAA